MTGLSAVIQARKPAFHVCLLATPSNRNSNANKICIGYNTTKLVSLCDHIIQHYTKNRKPFFSKSFLFMGNLRYDILLFNNSKILGREDFYFCRGFIFFFRFFSPLFGKHCFSGIVHELSVAFSVRFDNNSLKPE